MAVKFYLKNILAISFQNTILGIQLKMLLNFYYDSNSTYLLNTLWPHLITNVSSDVMPRLKIQKDLIFQE